MLQDMKKVDCCGCNVCYNICPKNAIEMKEDAEGFRYPYINEDKCIKCNLCKKFCPTINLKASKNKKNPNVIAGYSRNTENREESSSGGIFSELVRHFIEDKNGIVFGVVLDENFNAIEKAIDNMNDVKPIKGSKYIQADTMNTYNETKQYLEEGRYVLYSGTPCQIAALQSYLNKGYEKLYTCDIVCHGVPSQIVLQKYIKEMEQKYNSKIKDINFRDKKFGWNQFSMKIDFENGKTYRAVLKDDNFMRGFLENVYLRPSCYKCKFATLSRKADITLADFWGVESKYQEFNDNKGTSLILTNSEKGINIFNSIKDKLNYKEECDLKYAIEQNLCICGSVKKRRSRKKFFKNFYDMSFEQLIKKYAKTKKNILNIILDFVNKIRHN